jgi:hypothetical protein
MADIMDGARDEQAAAEHEEERRIFRAFQIYFASTDEGKQEGRWLNVANWEWIKAGSPTKIPVYGHPLRKVTFARFEREWRERTANGTPRTMTPPAKPVYRFGVRVG